jgi:hypothetical protein
LSLPTSFFEKNKDSKCSRLWKIYFWIQPVTHPSSQK